LLLKHSLITNDCASKALKIYKRRWCIENLFSHLKTKGFRFEETHMTDLEKIDVWMMILALAVIWTIKTSMVIREKISIASHGRKRKSIFKQSFEMIRKCLMYASKGISEKLMHYISFLKISKTRLEVIMG
jgi:transposase